MQYDNFLWIWMYAWLMGNVLLMQLSWLYRFSYKVSLGDFNIILETQVTEYMLKQII